MKVTGLPVGFQPNHLCIFSDMPTFLLYPKIFGLLKVSGQGKKEEKKNNKGERKIMKLSDLQKVQTRGCHTWQIDLQHVKHDVGVFQTHWTS